MASNNLRIIYQNVLDMAGTTITASSNATASTNVANLTSDIKSRVWRTLPYGSNNVSAKLVVTCPQANVVRGIIAAFSNLSSSATIRVRGYTGANASTTTGTTTPVATAGGVLVYDTGAVLAAPYQGTGNWIWGVSPLASNAYANTKVYGRVWTDGLQVSGATSYLIEIEDPNCADQYIEISRLILGNYWSPKYNTSYGLSSEIKDLSSSLRTEAGDLITNEAPYYNTLSLELKYMEAADRDELFKLLRQLGTRKPLFLSVFPNNTEDWGQEQIFQCYGKLSQLYPISHPMYRIFSSQLDMEEI